MSFGSLMILLSTQVNPLYSFVVYWVVFRTYFNRKEKELEDQILNAFDNDLNLSYYMPKTRRHRRDLKKKKKNKNSEDA